MKRLLIILCMLVNLTLFASDEIMHISKVYSNGTPKEVIVYRQVSDDLKTNNPFVIVKKITYDTKGNYIRPKLTGNAAIIQNQLIGKWIVSNEQSSNIFYIHFNRDGSYRSFNDEMFLDESIPGSYYLEQDSSQVIFNVKEDGWDEFQKATIDNDGRKKLTITFLGLDNGFTLTRMN